MASVKDGKSKKRKAEDEEESEESEEEPETLIADVMVKSAYLMRMPNELGAKVPRPTPTSPFPRSHLFTHARVHPTYGCTLFHSENSWLVLHVAAWQWHESQAKWREYHEANKRADENQKNMQLRVWIPPHS